MKKWIKKISLKKRADTVLSLSLYYLQRSIFFLCYSKGKSKLAPSTLLLNSQAIFLWPHVSSKYIPSHPHPSSIQVISAPLLSNPPPSKALLSTKKTPLHPPQNPNPIDLLRPFPPLTYVHTRASQRRFPALISKELVIYIQSVESEGQRCSSIKERVWTG